MSTISMIWLVLFNQSMRGECYIGVDIVDIPRIDSIIKSRHGKKFIKRIFTHREIDYCQSKANPSIHFSGRFAAKEAVKKALLSSKFVDNISFNSIEVYNEPDGAPVVNLSDKISKDFHCRVTISHTENAAIGFAMISTNS